MQFQPHERCTHTAALAVSQMRGGERGDGHRVCGPCASVSAARRPVRIHTRHPECVRVHPERVHTRRPECVRVHPERVPARCPVRGWRGRAWSAAASVQQRYSSVIRLFGGHFIKMLGIQDVCKQNCFIKHVADTHCLPAAWTLTGWAPLSRSLRQKR